LYTVDVNSNLINEFKKAKKKLLKMDKKNQFLILDY